MSHQLLKEARDCLEVLNDDGDERMQDLIDRIDNHLNSTISVIWDISDVQEMRPDLTDEQALEVLQHVKKNHDAAQGISWATLEFHAERLFGEEPDTRPTYTSLTMLQAYNWLLENDPEGKEVWDGLLAGKNREWLIDNVGQNLREYGDEGYPFCYVDKGLGPMIFKGD